MTPYIRMLECERKADRELPRGLKVLSSLQTHNIFQRGNLNLLCHYQQLSYYSKIAEAFILKIEQQQKYGVEIHVEDGPGNGEDIERSTPLFHL